MVADGELPAPRARIDLSRFAGGRIDLSQTRPETVFSQELRKVQLQGRLASFEVSDRCNVIESQLVQFETESVDFSRCDFKDNAFRNCRFKATRFAGAGFALNTLSECQFESCNFFDTVIQNCEFYDVEFCDCDLTSLVIKDCLFVRCHFKNCQTTNKLFEMCFLSGCRCEQTQLQLQTITENFGLRAKEVSLPLRSDRLDHPHTVLDRDAIAGRLATETHPLARLTLHYFLNEDLLEGSEHLDAALDVGYWIRNQSTAGSFSIVLTRFCEFLVHLHEHSEIAYLPLLHLHAVTGALAAAVPADTRMRQAAFAVYGTHLTIARQIDDYMTAVNTVCESRRRNWTFLIDGKHTRGFFRLELPELFLRSRPRIVSLVPHNSPWEMLLSFPSTAAVGIFFTLFLATRTRIELQQLLAESGPPRGRGRRTKSAQVALLTLGAAKGIDAKSLIHLKANISPTLVADFQLAVSTRCVGRVRKLILAWLK